MLGKFGTVKLTSGVVLTSSQVWNCQAFIRSSSDFFSPEEVRATPEDGWELLLTKAWQFQTCQTINPLKFIYAVVNFSCKAFLKKKKKKKKDFFSPLHLYVNYDWAIYISNLTKQQQHLQGSAIYKLKKSFLQLIHIIKEFIFKNHNLLDFGFQFWKWILDSGYL